MYYETKRGVAMEHHLLLCHWGIRPPTPLHKLPQINAKFYHKVTRAWTAREVAVVDERAPGLKSDFFLGLMFWCVFSHCNILHCGFIIKIPYWLRVWLLYWQTPSYCTGITENIFCTGYQYQKISGNGGPSTKCFTVLADQTDFIMYWQTKHK